MAMTNFRAEDMPGSNVQPVESAPKEEKKTSKPAAKAEPKKAAPRTRKAAATKEAEAPAEAKSDAAEAATTEE